MPDRAFARDTPHPWGDRLPLATILSPLTDIVTANATIKLFGEPAEHGPCASIMIRNRSMGKRTPTPSEPAKTAANDPLDSD